MASEGSRFVLGIVFEMTSPILSASSERKSRAKSSHSSNAIASSPIIPSAENLDAEDHRCLRDDGTSPIFW